MEALPAELISLCHSLWNPSANLSPAKLSVVQQNLSRAQDAPEAWTWAALALAPEQHDPYLRFFGAHTITYKIERDFCAMPDGRRDALCVSILSWVDDSAWRAYGQARIDSSSERIVLRKLATALAAVLIYSKGLGAWPDGLPRVIETLSGPRHKSSQALFEVMAEMAREERSLPKGLRKSDARKGPIAALEASDIDALQMTKLLVSALQPSQPACLSALGCLAVLLERGLLTTITLSTVYPQIPPLLGDDRFMDAAAGILEELLIKTTTIDGFITKERLDALASDFAHALSPAFERLSQDEGSDSPPLSLLKLFISLLEALIFDGITQRLLEPVAQQLLRNLIHLSTQLGSFGVDEDDSNLAFPLWLLLQEEAQDAGIRHDGNHLAAWEVLHTIYTTLWPLLLRKIRFDSAEMWSVRPKDLRESFLLYRREASEVFLSTYYILRQEMLVQLIDMAMSRCSAEHLEAALFVLKTIIEARSPAKADDFSPVGVFFASYVFEQQVHEALNKSELDFIGACAAWLSAQPQHIPKALDHLIASLQQSMTAAHAAKALQRLCKYCGSHLARHLDSFASLVASAFGHLQAEEFAALVGAVGTIVEGLRTESAAKATMSIGQDLIRAMMVDVSRLQQMQVNDRLYGLEAFCTFAKSISHTDVDLFDLDGGAEEGQAVDPFADTGQSSEILILRRHLYEALSLLANFAASQGQSERLQDLERLCMALTSSTTPTALSLDSLDVLEAASPCARQSLWLIVASRLVARVGRDGSVVDVRLIRLARINGQICAGAFSGDHAHDPDNLQALVDLQNAVLRHAPKVFEESQELLVALLDLAIRTLTLPERPAARSAVEFCSQLILDNDDVSRHIIASHARGLLSAALLRCLEHKQDCCLIADLIQPMTKRLPDVTRSALQDVLSQAGWAQTSDDKQRFLTATMRARTNKTCTAALEEFLR